MKRVFIIVLDSFGIGSTPDANKFGDIGANTLGHIAYVCAFFQIKKKYPGPLYLPNLSRLGLGKVAEASSGIFPIGLDKNAEIIGAYGYSSELSSGKDTSSGHWEITGVPVLFDWQYFIKKKNSFPKSLLNKLISVVNLPGYLGNCHSSGTLILKQLGEQHIKTGKPIFYTSTDSVFQIACHEQFFGLKKLYQLCQITRQILDIEHYNIGRVIARPFIGNNINNFQRTNNRRDFSIKPIASTVLEKLVKEKSGNVISIGKISDIYANVGITKKIKAYGIKELFDVTLKEIKNALDDTIVFTNFVDFDSHYGHRRDVTGYANDLELFDERLPEILKLIKGEDMLIITADHGCDPTWFGTNHTRENIPILIYGPKIKCCALGYRNTFADIGQTIAKYFNLSPMQYGSVLF